MFVVVAAVDFLLFGWLGGLVVLGRGLIVQGCAGEKTAGLTLWFHPA